MRLNVIEAGEGPRLVLLHGVFGAAGNWGAIQKVLAQRYQVMALDLRNHGASPHRCGMDYPTLAADVAETLGDRPAAVLGHSMGGKVAMLLALSRPAWVEKLIIADIAPVTYAPSLRPYVAAMQAVPLRPGLTRREADAMLAAAVPEPGIRAFLLQNLLLAETPPRWRLGLAELAAGMPEIEGFPPIAARYAGPTLVLTGGRSAYVRPEHQEGFLSLFPAAQFATIPGAGHWLHAEKPAEFLGAVERFLGA
jgi:pimeloyl-ACP methyl ester carboxylesterase